MKLLAGLLLCALVSGCASSGTKLDENVMAQVVKGQTTKSQVDEMLGPPNQQVHADDGTTTYIYVYTRTDVKGATFIPIVGTFAGGATAQTQTFIVHFGADGVVGSTSSSSGTYDSGLGLSAH